MDVAKWLKHATDLGGSGRGRPPIMDLRRGVSAAYYALFHELSRQAAEHALPRADAAQISALRRSYSHGSMRSVCSWIAGSSRPNGPHIRRVVTVAAANADVQHAAETFVDLQQRRHDADYDHEAVFSKVDVLNAVAQARAACAELQQQLRTESHDALMALLMLGTRDLR